MDTRRTRTVTALAAAAAVAAAALVVVGGTGPATGTGPCGGYTARQVSNATATVAAATAAGANANAAHSAVVAGWAETAMGEVGEGGTGPTTNLFLLRAYYPDTVAAAQDYYARYYALPPAEREAAPGVLAARVQRAAYPYSAGQVAGGTTLYGCVAGG